MAQHKIRLLHRVAVDWVADTFGLHTPDARTRHENARYRAAARAVRLHDRGRARAQASARALPDRLHVQRGEPRILKGWQARIGRMAGQNGDQS
jgi:RimJ/RimL family protein N-acetyltransferase